ncbi:MAG: universal stress protein [Haloplanus sp.]
MGAYARPDRVPDAGHLGSETPGAVPATGETLEGLRTLGGEPMTRTVLVPVDGSPLSFRALRHALTEFPDATIRVLHVVDLFDPESGPGDTTYEPIIGSEAWYDRIETATERLFDRVRERAAAHDRSVVTESEIGDPARIIVDYTEAEPVDHVVLGAHGRPAERNAALGHVASVVVRRAAAPVTVVR